MNDAPGGVTVQLGYDPPYDWTAMLAFFRLRAVAGIEQVDGEAYRRAIRHEGAHGIVEVSRDARHHSLSATIRLPSGAAPAAIIAGLRRMFDLDADVGRIGAHLARDPSMAPLVAARPAVRVPGGLDGFEAAARAVLGQQVSLAAARRLSGRLVERCGVALTHGADDALHRVFPTPDQVIAADLSGFGMPGARIAALKALAAAAHAEPALFLADASPEQTVARLRAIRGIGMWTAHYIAIRACREMDAFPASDVGLLRGAADASGVRPHPAALLARAEAWRPWRAYAAHHLWAVDAAARTAAGTR